MAEIFYAIYSNFEEGDMDSIKEYGNLSEKELTEFLAEIQNSNEDIEELEEQTSEAISIEELQSSLAVPLEISTRNEKLRKTLKDKAEKLKFEKIQIQREAFNQNIVDMSALIEKEHIKLLIVLLTKKHTYLADRYFSLINKRIATILMSFIPNRLRICAAHYPNSIRMCPGFMYKASKEYGQGLTLWVTPNVPYYFEQGTEQEVLQKSHPSFLYTIDKFIGLYYYHLTQRQDKELKYASAIVQKKVETYMDLLKLNPFWFKLLREELEKSKTVKDI